jgi:hypothetical protein
MAKVAKGMAKVARPLSNEDERPSEVDKGMAKVA